MKIPFQHFKNLLQKSIQLGLPGEEAQRHFAPLSRPLSSIAKKEASSYRESAVAIVLFQQNDEMNVLLIQRPTYDGAHSGQVAFPGGKREQTDQDLFQTAVRETYEEVGIELSEDSYVQALTPVFIPVTGFHVDVHLFVLNQLPALQLSEREVVEAFSVPLSDILDDAKIKRKDIRINKEIIIKDVPYFDLYNKVVWGATALMLGELRAILKGLPRNEF